MKNAFIWIAAALFLWSCDKVEEQVTESIQTYRFEPISTNELPENVSDHAERNYPNFPIRSAQMDAAAGYEVEISNGWQLYYTLSGNFLFAEANAASDDDIPVAISSLPVSILNYVSANYPNDTIVWAEMDDNQLEVYLSSGVELYFDAAGNFISADSDDDQNIDPASLPAAILTYIQQNFPNDSILFANWDDDGYYEIQLSSGVELYFDSTGNFISMDVDDMPINPTALPVNILNYIQQNYPNDSIVSAALDDNVYEIYLSSGIELYFDLNGNLIYVDVDDDYINPANLPAAILTYIQTNYPNLTIVEAEIDEGMYVVELSNELALYFDMNGNFLYADPD